MRFRCFVDLFVVVSGAAVAMLEQVLEKASMSMKLEQEKFKKEVLAELKGGL